MISNIVSAVGGFFNFVTYITDYFTSNDIRRTQEKIDILTHNLKDANETIRALKDKEFSDEETYKIECETKVSMLEAKVKALTRVNKKAREIKG